MRYPMMPLVMHHLMKLSWATVVVKPWNSMRVVLQNGSKSFLEYPSRLDLYATWTVNILPFGAV